MLPKYQEKEIKEFLKTLQHSIQRGNQSSLYICAYLTADRHLEMRWDTYWSKVRGNNPSDTLTNNMRRVAKDTLEVNRARKWLVIIFRELCRQGKA